MRESNRPAPSLSVAILKNVAMSLLLVGIVNLLIFSGLGFASSGTKGGRFIGPIPGWIIGIVWTALFVGLGVTRGVVAVDRSVAAARAGRAVVMLIIACAAYPFYTIGLQSEIIGLFGNLATIGLSVWVAARMARVRRVGVIAPLAVIAWVAFATAASIDEARLI
jgi:tryptophan-rich sensory protein